MGRWLYCRLLDCEACETETYHELCDTDEGKPVYRCGHCQRERAAHPEQSMAN